MADLGNKTGWGVLLDILSSAPPNLPARAPTDRYGLPIVPLNPEARERHRAYRAHARRHHDGSAGCGLRGRADDG